MHHFYSLLIVAIVIGASACNTGTNNVGSSVKNFEQAIDSGKVIAKAGDIEIHAGYLDIIARINPQLKPQIDSPMGRKKLIDTLVEQELLYRASNKAGLDDDPKVLEKKALYSRVITSQAYIENELEQRISDYYNEHKDDEFNRVQFSHIYLKTSAEKDKKDKKDQADPTATPEELEKKASETMKEVKAQLAQGADFAKLAEQYSEDVLSKKKGGDLGFVSRDDKRLQRKDWQPLVDKAFAMKAGEVSDVIETKNGLHIIKVVQDPTVAPLAEVENRIRIKLAGSIKKEIVDKLKDGEEVVYVDEAEAAPAPEAPAAPVAPEVPAAPAASPAPQTKN